MIFKITSEAAVRLLLLAAPTLPPPIMRPDITARQIRLAERKQTQPKR